MTRALPAIGFDFDHTLGIDNKLERVVFLRLLEILIDRGGRALGNLDEETKHIDALLAEQRGGAFSIDEAVARFIRVRSDGVDPQPFVRQYKEMALEGVATFVVPLPDTKGALADLAARGIACAILTNGWSPLQERKAARIGFTGPVVVSETIGIQKPDPRAFEALARALGRPVDEVWFVGDTPASDIAGAAAVGMRSVWLDAEAVPYPANLQAPDVTIHSLRALVEVLPGAPAPA